jgi:hypothetical protein
MKAILAALAFGALYLGAQGLTDAIERNTEARLRQTEDRAAYRQWATDACTPAESDQTAIVKRDGPRLRCSIFIRADYGLAPQLVSVAVLEPPL